MKKLFLMFGVLALAGALLGMTLAFAAGPKTLTWNAPTTYVTGEPLTVQQYKVYQNGSPIKSVPAPATSCTILRVAGATYHVTALDALGAESIASNSVAAGAMTPNAPTGCRWQ